MTATDTDDAEWGRPNQAAGVKTSPRTGPDSNLGLQATAKFNGTVSATVQGLVRKNATDQFTGELAWAFVKFKANDDWSFRVGRVGIPVYMISDFRNVGYANTMIRPPSEVYRQVTADSADGGDVMYQHGIGDGTLTAQFAIGRSRPDLPGGAYIEFTPASALHIVYEQDWFSLRFGRADATFSIRNNAALDGLQKTLTGLGLTQAASDYKIDKAKGSFTSVGATMDRNNILVQAEYAVRKTNSRIVMDTSSWYAMVGYRIGKFVPYYYHGSIKQDNQRHYTGLPPLPQLAPLAGALDYLGATALQSTNAIGVRWNFSSSAALKAQVDRISPEDGPGVFLNPKPGFKGPANVYAVGVDFVF
jgi:hypothetical protein